jgi:hypothetical protein
MISISDWWQLPDPAAHAPGLEQRYWSLLKCGAHDLERSLEPLDLNRIRSFDAERVIAQCARKLARSSRCKSGPGKASNRLVVSVAGWKATTTAKRTQRLCRLG